MGHLLGRNGCRQNFTTPGPAALQNETAIFGLHSLTEAMGSLTANSTRLIGAFHFSKLLAVISLYFDKG
jgi:hypothetical protein